jgi:hypothetical protein
LRVLKMPLSALNTQHAVQHRMQKIQTILLRLSLIGGNDGKEN